MDALQQLNIAAPVADIFGKLEYDIIVAIARQLSKNPDKLINHTSEWRIQMLARMGKVSKETARYIAQQTKDVPGDVEAIINEVVTAVLDEHGLAGNDKVIENLSKALEMYDHQAVKDKYNQVNTVMQYKARKAYVDGVNSVADRFEKGQIANKQEHLDILNKNALEVTLGEKSRTEAVRDTIREMSDKGIPAFVDASGREWSPEAYVSMDIRNTAKNAALMSEFECAKELGQDVILVSSHAAARPLCAPYQGKFYSLSGKAGTITDAYGKEYTYEPLSSTSYGEPAGLFGINCGHTFRGVEDGLFVNNEETYSEKENSEEYEKVQKQRRMEREIRKNKMKRDALKAAGDDEGAKEYDRKVREGNKRMNAYCEQNDLAVRMDRTQVYGYTDPNLKQKPKEFVKTVDKSGRSGIIKENNNGRKATPLHSSVSNGVSLSSGSSSFPETGKKRLYKHERIISRKSYETAILYDKNGNRVLTKSGEADNVIFSAKEIKEMEGCVLTHNHPNCSIFSPNDINIMRRGKLSEIRACNEYGTYVMQFSGEWPTNISSFSKIKKEYNKLYSSVGKEYQDIAAKEGKPIVAYLNEIDREFMETFCDTFGITFRWEAL